MTAPARYPRETGNRLEFLRLRLRCLESWKGQTDFEVYAEIQKIQAEIKTLDTLPTP